MAREHADRKDSTDAVDDGDLRGAFAALRAEDARGTESAEVMLGRARAEAGDESRRLRGWRPAGILALGLAAATSLWLALPVDLDRNEKPVTLDDVAMDRGAAGRPASDAFAAPGQWAMPSDVLLDLSALPGARVMQGLEWSLERTSPSAAEAPDLEGARSERLPGREPSGFPRRIG